MQALRDMQLDYLIEVYTEAANAANLHENGTRHELNGTQYTQHLQLHLGPHMVMLADHDIAWTFSQMATADIFVHSRSTLSISAGILNTQVSDGCGPVGTKLSVFCAPKELGSAAVHYPHVVSI